MLVIVPAVTRFLTVPELIDEKRVLLLSVMVCELPSSVAEKSSKALLMEMSCDTR